MDILYGSSINDISEFKNVLDKLFYCDHKNLYENVFDHSSHKEGSYGKLALFYQIFIKNPEQFGEFLEYILQPSLKFHDTVYKDVNVLTLMSCAVFHLSNIYTIINEKSEENGVEAAAKFFHKPFGKWLSQVIVDEKLKLHQNTEMFYNPFQYLMLMSYISTSLKMEERPLYIFLKQIKRIVNKSGKKIAHVLKLDIYEDILFPLVKEDYRKDIYDQILRDIVRIDYIYFLRSLDPNNKEPLKDNVFYNNEYKMEEFVGGDDEIFDNITEYIAEFQNLQETADKFNFMMYVFIEHIFGIYPYTYQDFTEDSDVEYEYDELWYVSMKVLFDRLKSSEHMHLDLKVFLYEINNYINFAHLHCDNSILLFPILDNPYFKENVIYIRNMLKALLTKKYDKCDVFGNIPNRKGEFNYIMIIDESTGTDVITRLLSSIFPNKKLHDNFAWHTDFMDSLQSIDSIPDVSVYSKESKSPDQNKLAVYFKNIIKSLLKLREKYNYNVSYNYLKNLYSFEHALSDIDIHLNEYKINTVTDTPSSMLRDRSVDVTPKLKDHEETIFKHKNNEVSFANKKLLKNLQKIYVKTVEGSAVDEYNKPNRILKIRKYLKNKYLLQMSDEIAIHDVENGNEFNMLFDIWKQRKNILLNAKFFIKYKVGIGIDDGGVTRHFFNNIVKQLQTTYFKPAYLGSDRYILNSKNIQSDDIAEFIGELLAYFVMIEIYLTFSLSMFYMANLMFHGNLSDEEKFLYFILDLDRANRYQDYLQYCKSEYTGQDKESTEYYNAMKCNAAYIVKEIFPTIYTHKQEHFAAFCKGFFIKKKIFYSKFANINSKIRMYDLDKLLSMPKLSKKVLKAKIFDCLQLRYNNYENPEDINEQDHRAEAYRFLKYIMINMKKSEYESLYVRFDTTIADNDERRQKNYANLKSFNVFKQNVLFHWTGSYGIHSELYKIAIDPNVNLFPVSHTCFNQLDLPLTGKIKSVEHFVHILIGIFVREENSVFDIS